MNDLNELFRWACEQSETAASIPPLAIHQSSMPRDHTGAPLHTGEIIRARPFTIAFERYVDQGWRTTESRWAKSGETFNPGRVEDAPIIQALADIHSDPSLRLEFEACWAIVMGGHNDLDILRAVLGRPNGLDEALRRGLSILRDKTTHIVQRQVAETSQRRETAGKAQLARAEDTPKKKRTRRAVDVV